MSTALTSAILRQILAIGLVLFMAPASAQKRVALLVGNGQYQHESALANPGNDVRLLAKVMRAAPLNFKVELLENQDRREMDLAIKRFVRESAGADTALLYYAGHGAQPSKGGRSYLLPVNAKAVDDDSLETDGILAESIAAQLEQQANPAKLRLVVLDACRNTRMASSSRSTVRGLAPPARTDSYTLIAYSTDANSVAQDGSSGYSPYAKALAQHLPRAATEPVRVVFEDTARDVRSATRQAQSPRTYGDLESRVALDGVQLASVRSGSPAPLNLPSVPSTTTTTQAGGMSRIDALLQQAKKLPACQANGQDTSRWDNCWGRIDMGGGEYYEGVIRNGFFAEVGTYYWKASGSYYKGEWREGRRHGHGLLVALGNESFNPAANFDQPWSKNAPSSMLVNQNAGDVYEGEWRHNRRPD
jgi:hypothetical protein